MVAWSCLRSLTSRTKLFTPTRSSVTRMSACVMLVLVLEIAAVISARSPGRSLPISTRIFTHAIEAVSPDALAETRQSGGGEDFSWYLEEVPGAMARLGVWSGRGPQLDLHQPNFDLDERALGVGVRVLANVVERAGAF